MVKVLMKLIFEVYHPGYNVGYHQSLINYYSSGLSLIFEVDGEL